MEDGMSFGRAITALAEEDPDRPAVTGWDDGTERTITRAELEARANRTARAWQELGVGEGDLVSIALPNSIAFVVSTIAAWKLGAVPQPVSARLPDRERQAIVELADSKLVVGTDSSTHPGRHVLPVGWDPDATIDDGPLPDRVSPAQRAMTSGGSTGRPKLIVNSSPGVVNLALMDAVQVHENGTQVVAGPLYHNGPFTLATGGLCRGHHIVVFPRFDPEATLRAIDVHRATFLFLVPTMMLRIWRLGEEVRAQYDVSSVETLWHFAAPCPEWLKGDWIDWLGAEKVWELYGGTELQAMTVIRGDDWLAHRGSVGRCVIGEMKVFDPDTGAALAPGDVGEIYMRRDAAGTPAYHYVGSEARTLPGNWESLGDIGTVDADGYVYLSDRRTDMILVGGENVYPAEVEGALMEHPHVLS